MADDKTKRGKSDRRRVSAGDSYEVTFFAKKHSIAVEDAERIIEQTGGNRAEADAEAAKLKAGETGI
jgi:hypothetical protein